MPKVARKNCTFSLPAKLIPRIKRDAAILYGSRGLSFWMERAAVQKLSAKSK